MSHDAYRYTIKHIPCFWNSIIKPSREIKIGFNTKLDPGGQLEPSDRYAEWQSSVSVQN